MITQDVDHAPGTDARPDYVLVVDDQADIAALVAYHLAKRGYRVSTAGDGDEALDAAVRERPDLLVLDLTLPRRSGFDILEELRARPETRGMGIILLTARTGREDRLRGLALGADDYVAKPFSPDELALRVAAVLRRMRAPSVGPSAGIVIGPLRIDPGAHRVVVDDNEVSLTATEFRLLVILVERRGRVQSRARLLEDVWNSNPDIDSRKVDIHVQRLRSKIGSAASMIETVRGVGYRFRGERGTANA